MSTTDINTMYLKKEGIEWRGNELLVAVEPQKELYISELIGSISKIQVRDKVWQSKYNSYVQYNRVPLCASGFIINFYLKGSIDYLCYTKSLIEKAIKQREMLENIYTEGFK